MNTHVKAVIFGHILGNTMSQDKLKTQNSQQNQEDYIDLLILGIKSFIDSNKEINPYPFRNNLIDINTDDSILNIIVKDPFFIDDDISLAARRFYIYNNNLRSNGGIMRTCWIGASQYKNIGLLAYHTISNCIITNCDPFCVGSALFINILIAEILNSNSNSNINFTSLIEKVKKSTESYLIEYIKEFNIKMMRDINNLKKTDPFYNMIKQNYKNKKMYHVANVMEELHNYTSMNNLDNLNIHDNISYTILPVAIAVISLKKIITNNTNFIDVIKDIINMGGDVNTNCAITGAVCGAFIGFEKLPHHNMEYNNFITELVEKFII